MCGLVANLNFDESIGLSTLCESNSIIKFCEGLSAAISKASKRATHLTVFIDAFLSIVLQISWFN